MNFESDEEYERRMKFLLERSIKEAKAGWPLECLRLSSLIARETPEPTETTIARAGDFLNWLYREQ